MYRMCRKTMGLLFLLVVLVLSGCAQQQKPEQRIEETGPYTLRVLTDRSADNDMNFQVTELAKRFEADNPDVTIALDIMPWEPTARAAYLEQLRTEIMAGRGPDVYLLPTDGVTYGDSELVPGAWGYRFAEVLFADVNQVMRRGIFADISQYYDSDATLGKDGLQPQVMDAGVVEGQRYVLPLRFGMPLLFANEELLESHGMKLSDLNVGVTELAGAIAASGDPVLAQGLNWREGNWLLPDLWDYTSGKIKLEKKQLVDFFTNYQALTALRGNSYLTGDLLNFTTGLNANWCSGEFPLYTGTLFGAVETAAVAKLAGIQATALPLRAMDGSIIAEVAYYGAVGADCKHPKEAYEFLRMFLSEEAQWSGENLRRYGSPSLSLVNISYPVRTVGSVAALWDYILFQINAYNQTISPPPLLTEEQKELVRKQQQEQGAVETPRYRIPEDLALDDSDLAVLQMDFDLVRFPVVLDFDRRMFWKQDALNDPKRDNIATDVDIETLAQEYMDDVIWLMAEG